MNRNTELRKKVVNVGRPDTTSTLAKQSEIQKKVIDEAEKKATTQDLDDATEVKGGTTQVNFNPKTDDVVDNSESDDKESKKARFKANKEIGVKGAPSIKEDWSDSMKNFQSTMQGYGKTIDKNVQSYVDHISKSKPSISQAANTAADTVSGTAEKIGDVGIKAVGGAIHAAGQTDVGKDIGDKISSAVKSPSAQAAGDVYRKINYNVGSALDKVNPYLEKGHRDPQSGDYVPDDPKANYGGKDFAADVASMVPGVGAGASAYSAKRSLGRGEYGMAAVDAAGVVAPMAKAAKAGEMASALQKGRSVAYPSLIGADVASDTQQDDKKKNQSEEVALFTDKELARIQKIDEALGKALEKGAEAAEKETKATKVKPEVELDTTGPLDSSGRQKKIDLGNPGDIGSSKSPTILKQTFKKATPGEREFAAPEGQRVAPDAGSEPTKTNSTSVPNAGPQSGEVIPPNKAPGGKPPENVTDLTPKTPPASQTSSPSFSSTPPQFGSSTPKSATHSTLRDRLAKAKSAAVGTVAGVAATSAMDHIAPLDSKVNSPSTDTPSTPKAETTPKVDTPAEPKVETPPKVDTPADVETPKSAITPEPFMKATPMPFTGPAPTTPPMSHAPTPPVHTPPPAPPVHTAPPPPAAPVPPSRPPAPTPAPSKKAAAPAPSSSDDSGVWYRDPGDGKPVVRLGTAKDAGAGLYQPSHGDNTTMYRIQGEKPDLNLSLPKGAFDTGIKGNPQDPAKARAVTSGGQYRGGVGPDKFTDTTNKQGFGGPNPDKPVSFTDDDNNKKAKQPPLAMTRESYRMPNQNPMLRSDRTYGISSSMLEAAKSIMTKKAPAAQEGEDTLPAPKRTSTAPIRAMKEDVPTPPERPKDLDKKDSVPTPPDSSDRPKSGPSVEDQAKANARTKMRTFESFFKSRG